MVPVSYLCFIVSVLPVLAHAECAEGRTGTCKIPSALGDHNTHADDDSVAIEMQFQLLQSNSFLKPTDDEDAESAEEDLELDDEAPFDEQFLTENSVLPGGSKSIDARALKAKIAANQFSLKKQFNLLRNTVEKALDDDSYTHNNTKLQNLVVETEAGPESALLRALKGKITARKFKLRQQWQKLRADYEKGEKQVDAVQNISDEALFSTSTEGLPEVLQELVMDTSDMPGGPKSLVVQALKAKITAHQYIMKQKCEKVRRKLRRFAKEQEEDSFGEKPRNSSAVQHKNEKHLHTALSQVAVGKDVPQQLVMEEEDLSPGAQAAKRKLLSNRLEEERKVKREQRQVEARKNKIVAQHWKEETLVKKKKVNVTKHRIEKQAAARRTRAGTQVFKEEEKQIAGKVNDRRFAISVAKARNVADEKQHLLDRLHHLRLLEVVPYGKTKKGLDAKSTRDEVNKHHLKEHTKLQKDRKEEADEKQDLEARIESLKKKRAERLLEKKGHLPAIERLQSLEEIRDKRLEGLREKLPERPHFSLNLMEGTPQHVAAVDDADTQDEANEKQDLTARIESLKKKRAERVLERKEHLPATERLQSLEEIRNKRLDGLREKLPERPHFMEHAANSLAKTLALMQVKPLGQEEQLPPSGSEKKDDEVEKLPTGVSITKPIVEAMKSKMFGDAHKEKVKMQSLRETLRKQMQDTAAKLEAKVMKTNDRANQHMKDSFGSLAKAFAMLQEEPVKEELPMEELVASGEEQNKYIPRGGYKALLEDAERKKLQKKVARATYNSYERRQGNEHKIEKLVNESRQHKMMAAYHAEKVLENIVKRSS